MKILALCGKIMERIQNYRFLLILHHTYLQPQFGEKKLPSILSSTNIFVWHQYYLNPEFQKNQSRALKENLILSFFTTTVKQNHYYTYQKQVLVVKIIVSNVFSTTTLRKKYPLLLQTFNYMARNQEKPHLQDFTISQTYSLHKSCYHHSWPYSSMFVIKVGTFFLKVVMENTLDTINFTCNTYFQQLQQ